MEVILFETVQNLGRVGDQVKVKPGYARNYLIPQGKAALASPEAVQAVEARRAELEQQEAEQHTDAQSKAERIDGKRFTVARKAGEEGKLFGSVGTADLVEIMADAGVEITRHDVLLPEGPLRQVGEYDIQLRFHTEVEATVHISVVPE